MKVIHRKVQKDRALTIHVTSAEEKYLRAVKRETGRSISDIIREVGLTAAAEEFFAERQKSRNGRPVSSAAPVQ